MTNRHSGEDLSLPHTTAFLGQTAEVVLRDSSPARQRGGDSPRWLKEYALPFRWHALRLTAAFVAWAAIIMTQSLPGFSQDAGVSEETDLSQFADGRSDATTALQQQVDASVGRLVLPSGILRLTQPIEIDLTKVGYISIEGSAATKVVMEGEGPAFRLLGSHFKSADPAGFSQQVWDRERMPTFVGFAIEGAHPQANGIEANGTMQLTCSRLHLRKLQHAIHLHGNNRNVLIDACHIYENRGIGIYYDDVNLHQSNIVGCHISYCDQGGIVSRKGNVRNIHISGCDLESNMSAETDPTANILIDCRGSDYGTAEVAITGCTIQHNDTGPESANIRIMGATNPSAALPVKQEGHVTITGNVLSDVQTNIWLEGCRGVTLTGNTFWMGFDYNLLIEDCSHIMMAANNFDRNPRYDYGRSLQAKNRLLIRDSRDCTLTGIHIAQAASPALTLESCHRMNVTGLTILDCDLGLQLVNVSRSQFSGCLIRDDRDASDSRAVSITGSVDNQYDSLFERLLP